MAGSANGGKSYVYVGLAGETAPGRQVNAGLFRMTVGDGGWEKLGTGLPDTSAIRSIVVRPDDRSVVYVGTQDGPYRSDDHGDHWERLPIRDHGHAVWSLLLHPRDPDVMYAGYEACEIFRSEDGGESWRQLPVSVRFPEITVGPGANLAKRILGMSASLADPDELYGALEVGGVIRSLDGGEHWESLSHGQYLNDDLVDAHGVMVSRLRQGTVFSIARAGMFRSSDRGDHWLPVRLQPLNEKGQTYCRRVQEVPGDPSTIWVAAGSGFQGDLGVLFRSTDGGTTFERVDIGHEINSTLFGLAFDERQPSNMFCAASRGQVFGSGDGGQTWNAYPLPEGSSQVYPLACG